MRSISLVLLSLSAIPSSTFAGPLLRNLGTHLSGLGASSEAVDINNNGQVAGISRGLNGNNFEIRAFRYSGIPGQGGSMTVFPGMGYADEPTFATAINSDGVVAGYGPWYGRALAARSNGDTFAIVGTRGVTPEQQRIFTSYAYGINDSGTIAGVSEGIAFNGSAPGLGTLGGTTSVGKAINNSGLIVGESDISGNEETHAFLYRGTPGVDGEMLDLGTLGGFYSSATAINNAGEIAGTSYLANGQTRAFLYKGMPGAGGTMINLGALPGDAYSSANDINNRGQIVGESDAKPFLYVGTPGAGGQMIDLNAWLDAVDPATGALWTIDKAAALNDRGYIAGNGFFDDGVESYSRAIVLDVIRLTGIRGDANRDNAVNFDDLLKLAQRYGNNTGQTWDDGDFDANGAVNFDDLLALAQNYSSSSVLGSTEGFAADWALAQSLVPEPGSLSVLAFAFAMRKRRR